MIATICRAVLAAAWLTLYGSGDAVHPGADHRVSAGDRSGDIRADANTAPPVRPGEGEITAATAGIEPAGGHPPAEGGTLRGRVRFSGPAPARQKAMVVKDVAVCGRINHLDDRLVVGSTGGIRYAVVSIQGVKGGKSIAAMGKEFVLDQRTCAYNPHVLLVPKGEQIKILNNDGVLHNIHTFSRLNKPFNIAQPKVLKEIHRSFTECERIPVKCDVHGWMSSWVVVVDHPYHAVTDTGGRFEITGIPPGRYTVECWQEELGTRTAEVTIGGGDSIATHDFVYPKEQPASPVN